MIRTIKGAKRSPRYKAQKLFVLTDVGAHFKYRFCVIGIPAEMYRFTRYFKTESKPVFILKKFWSETKILFQTKIGALRVSILKTKNAVAKCAVCIIA